MLFFISRDGTVWRNPWCCLRTLEERTWQNMPPICHASPPSWSTARTSFWTVWRMRMDRTIWSGCLRWVHVSLNVVTSCLCIVSLKFSFFLMIELLNVVIHCVEILFLKYVFFLMIKIHQFQNLASFLLHHSIDSNIMEISFQYCPDLKIVL